MMVRTEYQNGLIANYFKNIDNIMLQKLSDLVSELYLADTEQKKQKLWKRVKKALEKLKISPAIVDHIMEEKNPEILAKNLQEWIKI